MFVQLFGSPFSFSFLWGFWISFQVLGESLHITSEYLTQEAKVASLTSRIEALEAENSMLKKNFIDSTGEATSLKEKVKTLSDDLRAKRQLTLEKDEQLLSAKEKLKTIAARFVKAFQTTDEYNTVLFNRYFKGFELLRRYLITHPSEINLEKLDLEEVDQEMVADEATQSSATETAPEHAPTSDVPTDDDVTADTRAWYFTNIFQSFFFGRPSRFGSFCKSNSKTISF